MAKINFFRGLAAKYNSTTHADAIFFATDTHEIKLNGVSYGLSTTQAESFNSSIAAIDAIAKSNQTAISTINNKLSGIAEGAQVNVIESVKVDGNALTITNKSVNVEIATPIATAKGEAISASAVTMSEAAGTGNILKTYTFTQNGQEIGKINLAKDLVVSGGSIIEKEGVKYLALNIANQETPVEIPVTDLVDVYGGSAYINVTADNSIEIKFNDLDAALAAESTTIGGNIKANADAIITEKNRAEEVESKLRSDLGIKAEGAADAFTRIAALEATVGNSAEGNSLAARVEANEQAIDAIEADYLKAADKTELSSTIATVKATADAAATKAALEAEAELARAAEQANATAAENAQNKANEAANAASANATEISNIKAYTVNGKAISTNPVLAGSDVKLTGYTMGDGSAILATDSIMAAIAKLEYNLTWHEAA